MLATGADFLEAARADRRALAGFSTYSLESTRAICEAAEVANRPVLLQVSEGAFAASSFAMLSAAILAAARSATVPVGVHLDHARDLGLLEACLEAGFTSVMIDGSSLGLEDNVALTARAAELAHALGAWIEAELGPIAGDEHRSIEAVPDELTDPSEAGEFARATGIDLLAAAVGTVHGAVRRPVGLDVARIAAIVAHSGRGFCLHGGSGCTPDELAAAIDAGTVKVNVNTELRQAYRAAATEALGRSGDEVTAVMAATTEAMREVCLRVLATLEAPRGGRGPIDHS